jgi:hypothetical protein
MVVREELTHVQVERILHSETFRNSDVLRRLLRFLADKTLSGEGDQLKEYAIGIDALGKPTTYDPRQDSVVRIQVGRLRQKLTDYYRTEGRDDSLIVDIPKGRFKLAFEPRPEPLPIEHLDPTPIRVPAQTKAFNWRRITLVLGAVLGIALVWGVYATAQWIQERKANAPLRSAWTPELTELWKPFLASNRPLIVSVAAPLFVGFQGTGFYRDLTLNRWDDVLQSPKVSSIRKALNNPVILPRYYYTGIGEMSAAFHLGKLLTVSPINVSVARSSQLSWQQLADNNVLFIGAPRLYAEQLKGLPVELDIALEESGIRILRPQPGEPAQLEDHYPTISAPEKVSVPDDGEVYALITHTPGPLGSGDMQSFTANHSPGTLAAVQWFTNPDLARILTRKLRKPNSELPRFYQIVLSVKYKDAVPTEVSYVLHHELGAERRLAAMER